MASNSPRALDNLSILSLRAFVAVVESQSFSSAARQLGIAPSTVTKHVQWMETAMDTALIHRTTRRLSVTSAGETFYKQSIEILGKIERAAVGANAEKEQAGELRVAAPPSFVTAVLADRIHEFRKDYPGISIDLIVSSATPNMVRDRIDIAITVAESLNSKPAHTLLAECPRVLCAAPGYLQKFGAPMTPNDLHQHECLRARFSELVPRQHSRDELS